MLTAEGGKVKEVLLEKIDMEKIVIDIDAE